MLTPNTVLQNRYRIVRQLGRGGMGTVYEAEDLRLHTNVALKETHFTEETDAGLRRQFEREARLLARLRHQSLPRVSDHFDEGGGLYLVMDFVEGDNLQELLQRRGGAFPVGAVLAWADQLLDALIYLHGQEPPVIHRDIKPENLKLTARGQIILLDFGLAKGFTGQSSRASASASVYGYTRSYAPLEQIQGAGTDARSDLYALAATLYQLMTAKLPPDVLTRLAETTDGRPDSLVAANELNWQVPKSVAGVLTKAMSIGRSQRYADALWMREALRAAHGETEVVAPPPTTIIAGAAVENEGGAGSPSSETTVAGDSVREPKIWRPAPHPVPENAKRWSTPESSARIEEPAVAIYVSRQYPRSKTAEDLYQATRSMWRVNLERARRARYAFAVYQGEVKEVYEIERWMPATAETRRYWREREKMQGDDFQDTHDGRSEFIGRLAPEPIRKKYLGQRMPRSFGSPVLYFNC